MKLFFKSTFFILVAHALVSCDNEVKSYNIEFIKKHGTETFGDFINTGIAVRNFDANGNIILFIGDLQNTNINGPYIVKIDTIRDIIIETSCKLLKDSSLVDKEKFNDLALKFMSYDINYLKVDTNNNVFINVMYNERPSLIRFSNLKYKTGIYKEDWKLISSNWYEDEINP